MRIVTFKQISELGISPATCVKWVDEALRMKGGVLLPHKISLKPGGMPDVFYNTMPCLVPKIARGGVKVVTRYPGRTPSLDSELLLYDLSSGECLALMDADWITTMRTGAVAAHSIGLLAREGWSRVGIMGLGNTARATMLCLAATAGRPLDVGLLRYKDQHEDFARRFAGLPGVAFHYVDTVASLARESDVLVSCVTAAPSDLCEPGDFPPGSLLVPVHTRGFTACDLAFDKVFCDDEDHVSGFGYYPQFKARLVEVADVVRGNAPGREGVGERILVYNIGISLHDVFFASRVFDMLGGGGEAIDLAKPNGKFWV